MSSEMVEMIRRYALDSALKAYSGSREKPETIVKAAKAFEQYVNGQVEFEQDKDAPYPEHLQRLARETGLNLATVEDLSKKNWTLYFPAPGEPVRFQAPHVAPSNRTV